MCSTLCGQPPWATSRPWWRRWCSGPRTSRLSSTSGSTQTIPTTTGARSCNFFHLFFFSPVNFLPAHSAQDLNSVIVVVLVTVFSHLPGLSRIRQLLFTLLPVCQTHRLGVQAANVVYRYLLGTFCWVKVFWRIDNYTLKQLQKTAWFFHRRICTFFASSFLEIAKHFKCFFYFCRLYLIPLPYYRAIRARISS